MSTNTAATYRNTTVFKKAVKTHWRIHQLFSVSSLQIHFQFLTPYFPSNTSLTSQCTALTNLWSYQVFATAMRPKFPAKNSLFISCRFSLVFRLDHLISWSPSMYCVVGYFWKIAWIQFIIHQSQAELSANSKLYPYTWIPCLFWKYISEFSAYVVVVSTHNYYLLPQ